MDVLQFWMNDLAIPSHHRFAKDFVLYINSGLASLDHVLQEFCDVISKHQASMVSRLGSDTGRPENGYAAAVRTARWPAMVACEERISML